MNVCDWSASLAHQRQVVTAEAVGMVVLVVIIHIGPSEGDRLESLLTFIFPHGGSNAAKPEGLHRQVRGGSGVLILSRRLSVF